LMRRRNSACGRSQRASNRHLWPAREPGLRRSPHSLPAASFKLRFAANRERARGRGPPIQKTAFGCRVFAWPFRYDIVTIYRCTLVSPAFPLGEGRRRRRPGRTGSHGQ
jgi:hypothetical protein